MRNYVALLALVCSLSGCAPVMSVRVSTLGRHFPAKPPDCSVVWESLELQDQVMRYETIGIIAIGVRGDDVSPEIKERVRVESCLLGADAVTVAMSSEMSTAFGGQRGISIKLLRKRTTALPPTPVELTAPSAPRPSDDTSYATPHRH